MSAGLLTSETVGDATGVTGDTVSIGAEMVAVISAGDIVADTTGVTVSIVIVAVMSTCLVLADEVSVVNCTGGVNDVNVCV